LSKPCHHCGKLMDLPWNVCPFCATPELGLRTENLFISENLEDKMAGVELRTEPETKPETEPETVTLPAQQDVIEQDNHSYEP
ncbi:MAG: hypothetical protein UU16_C0017G0001, partial [Candidatus Woesebacteria bacterium GW2011_GWA2_40_7]